jgi:uncharacterized membrane protein YbhN (UPF0104 family)
LAGAGRKSWIVAQWLFAAAVIWYAATALAGQWEEAGDRFARLRPHWGYVATASILILSTYALLIETWRRLLAEWSARLPWPVAARIWLASNLGKYVPGKIWSIFALGALAKARGASAVAAGGSSVLLQLVSIVTGVAVALAFGAQTARALWLAAFAVIAAIAALLSAPALLPRAFAVIQSLTGRELAVPPIPARAIWLATGTTAIAWIVSGYAFAIFAESLDLGRGPPSAYIAVYATSYVAGFVALFAPGGIGVREGALIAAMQVTGVATAAEAAIIAVASRIWLTVLDLIPGMIALALGRREPRRELDSSG